MEPAVVIQGPTVIAQIPRPLDPDNGKTHTSDVHNLVNSRKRKRSELAVAADGESVNIYDVKGSQLLTSHPVPPQSSFTCPPCSIRQKASRSSPALRRTFCALQTPEPEIVLFLEERHEKSITHHTRSRRIPAERHTSQILTLDVIPTRSQVIHNTEAPVGNDIDLICVHHDGRVRRVSGDLEEELWNVNPLPTIVDGKAMESISLKAAFLVDLDVARTSILKRREDILATVAAGVDPIAPNDYSILIMVSYSDNSTNEQTQDLLIDFFAIPWSHESGTLFFAPSQNVMHLMRSDLPNPLLSLEQASDFKLHSLSGTLYLKVVKDLLAYDLCEYIPRLISHIKVEKEHVQSSLRLSSSSVLVSTNKSVNVYNTRYQSLQASLKTDELSLQLGKRKRQSAPMNLISFYPKLSVAVALQGNSLVGLQLSLTRKKRGKEGLLIDSIGRGIGTEPITNAVKQPNSQIIGEHLKMITIQEDPEWNVKKAELDAYVLSRNIESFERVMASELSQIWGKQPRRLSPGGSASNSVEMENGSADQVDQEMISSDEIREQMNLHLPSQAEYVEEAKVHYLLSKIFSWERSHVASSPLDELKISFFPPTLFRWLVTRGKLSSANIELALRKENGHFPLLHLPDGSIIKALATFDPSLKWLIFMLRESNTFSTDELVLTTKLLLQFDSQGGDEEPKLLTNGSHHPTDTQSSESSQHSKAASQSSPTLLNVTTALNLALSILHAHHPPPNITKSLRSHLNRAETFTIVHHLRLCLASEGWTSLFTDHHSTTFPNPSNPQEPPQLALSIITTLLNCTVDAIGAAGFLSAVSATPRPQRALSADDMDLDVIPEIGEQDEQEEDLIPFMKDEISAALAGVEESSYLRGILREFLRYTSSQPTTNLPRLIDTSATDPALAVQPSRSVWRENGAEIHTLISSRPDGREMEAGRGALPLSLKAEGADKDMKTRLAGRNGERVQRSKRDIGRLHLKRVGRYSFERIVF